MRPGPLAVVAIVAAALGAVAVLVVGRTLDWVGPRDTETVFVRGSDGALAADVERLPPTRPLGAARFDPARLYAARSSGVVTIFAYFDAPAAPQASASQGSGFVVSRSGYILTNSHVITNAGEDDPVEAADDVYVQFSDHDRVRAEVVGWDVFDDIGLLKVDPARHRLDPVPLGVSARVVVGEPVAAIGSPFGNESSLAVGVVSGVRRSISSLTSSYRLVDAIQTDAPITHGNSGGPLFDAHGRVIGVNAQIRSQGDGNDSGVGFAVPIDAAKRSMEELIRHGEVRYACVGIQTTDLTPSLARHLRYRTTQGAIVDEVLPGTPGFRAGLRSGSGSVEFNGIEARRGADVIVAIDGRSVRSADDVVRIVTGRLRPGDTSIFTVVRSGGQRRNLAVRLAERPCGV